jgi:hypothetical protein
MLSVVGGVFVLIPITFGIAGYVPVSRDGARPIPTITPGLPIKTKDLDAQPIELERTANHD